MPRLPSWQIATLAEPLPSLDIPEGKGRYNDVRTMYTTVFIAVSRHFAPISVWQDKGQQKGSLPARFSSSGPYAFALRLPPPCFADRVAQRQDVRPVGNGVYVLEQMTIHYPFVDVADDILADGQFTIVDDQFSQPDDPISVAIALGEGGGGRAGGLRERAQRGLSPFVQHEYSQANGRLFRAPRADLSTALPSIPQALGCSCVPSGQPNWCWVQL